MRIPLSVLLSLSCVLLGTASAAYAYTHNITAVRGMVAGARPINIPTAIEFEFWNSGTSPETNVTLHCSIESQDGVIYYTDSILVRSWLPDARLDTTFQDFTPSFSYTTYVVTADASLSSDEYRQDDTLQSSFYTRYESDLAVVNVVFPPDGDSITEGTSFQIRGSLVNVGASDIYEFPIRAAIRRASDGVQVFQADTIVQAAYVDSPAIEIRFPPKQGSFDVQKLKPGRYVVAAIVRYPIDGDRTNDTAYSSFVVTTSGQSDVGVEAGLPVIFLVPNPAHSFLEVKGFTGGRIEVFGIDGRHFECPGVEHTDHSIFLDIRNLPPGKYFVQKQGSDGTMRTCGFQKE